MRSSHRSRFRIQDGCEYWLLRDVRQRGASYTASSADRILKTKRNCKWTSEVKTRHGLGLSRDVDGWCRYEVGYGTNTAHAKGDARKSMPRPVLDLGFGSDATRRFPSSYSQYTHQRWHQPTLPRQTSRVTNYPSPSQIRMTRHRLRFSSPKAPKLWFTAQPSSHLQQLVHSNTDRQSHGDIVPWTCD